MATKRVKVAGVILATVPHVLLAALFPHSQHPAYLCNACPAGAVARLLMKLFKLHCAFSLVTLLMLCQKTRTEFDDTNPRYTNFWPIRGLHTYVFLTLKSLFLLFEISEPLLS